LLLTEAEMLQNHEELQKDPQLKERLFRALRIIDSMKWNIDADDQHLFIRAFIWGWEEQKTHGQAPQGCGPSVCADCSCGKAYK
jgi:hypothetical protein